MLMVTIEIDNETFARWSRQAAAAGVTVEQWLKATTSDRQGVGTESIEERLERFDALTSQIAQGTGSGGDLEDSRETIYRDRAR
jgi:hypothetical protein